MKRSLSDWLVEKLNPSQHSIADDSGPVQSTEPVYTYQQYYSLLEIVNRGVNMIVDDSAEIGFSVGEDKIVSFSVNKNPTKRKTMLSVLNIQPNPYQDIHSFRRACIMDFVIDGNIFIYFDGLHMYQLPAAQVIVHPDKKEFIDYYEFDNTKYAFDEIIHIKDNNSRNVFRGVSRLKSAKRSMDLLKSMNDFQDNFFSNGAIPGLVIQHPDILSPTIKKRMKDEWRREYRPQAGGRRPLILDGGMKLSPISNTSFKELDFSQSIETSEHKILKALGIPPVLLDGGNNVNIRPNHRIYYLETIVPIVKKIASAFQNYFGFSIKEDVAGIPALQPELREQAAYVTTLVNGGIITPDEGREELGRQPLADGSGDSIRIPQNIAGSAVNPDTGGRPEGDNNDN